MLVGSEVHFVVVMQEHHLLLYLILKVFVQVPGHHWSWRMLDHGARVHGLAVRGTYLLNPGLGGLLLGEHHVLRVCNVIIIFAEALPVTFLRVHEFCSLVSFEVGGAQVQYAGSLHLLRALQVNNIADALVPLLGGVLDGR